MIIDAHSHVHDPVDAHIALLDEAGVDRAVLFGTRPHPERATDLATLRHEMSVLDAAMSGSAMSGSAMSGSSTRAEDKIRPQHQSQSKQLVGY